MRSTCSSTSFSSPRTRCGVGAEQFAQQVEVALDHRDRVVDLVRDAGGELADGGELLAAHQLLLRRLAAARVRSATLASSSAFQRCRARVLSSMASSRWSRWPASGPISSRLATAPTRASSVAVLDPLHGLRPSARAGAKMLRAQRSETSAAATITAKKISADGRQRAVLQPAERLLEEADVEHAHALARRRRPAAGSPRRTSR